VQAMEQAKRDIQQERRRSRQRRIDTELHRQHGDEIQERKADLAAVHEHHAKERAELAAKLAAAESAEKRKRGAPERRTREAKEHQKEDARARRDRQRAEREARIAAEKAVVARSEAQYAAADQKAAARRQRALAARAKEEENLRRRAEEREQAREARIAAEQAALKETLRMDDETTIKRMREAAIRRLRQGSTTRRATSAPAEDDLSEQAGAGGGRIRALAERREREARLRRGEELRGEMSARGLGTTARAPDIIRATHRGIPSAADRTMTAEDAKRHSDRFRALRGGEALQRRVAAELGVSPEHVRRVAEGGAARPSKWSTLPPREVLPREGQSPRGEGGGRSPAGTSARRWTRRTPSSSARRPELGDEARRLDASLAAEARPDELTRTRRMLALAHDPSAQRAHAMAASRARVARQQSDHSAMLARGWLGGSRPPRRGRAATAAVPSRARARAAPGVPALDLTVVGTGTPRTAVSATPRSGAAAPRRVAPPRLPVS